MLLVGEIFKSISGEVGFFPQGTLCTFLRLAGCNYKCKWCDTKNYIPPTKGMQMPMFLVSEKIEKQGLSNLVVTGGEPLLQKHFLAILLERLIHNERSLRISIETNGSIQIPVFDIVGMRESIGWVIDVKMPSSGHYSPYWFVNLPRDLNTNDWLKFVIYDENDYQEALKCYRTIKDTHLEANIAFSPILSRYDSETLFDNMIKDGLYDVVMNLQIHKFIKLP